MKMRFYIAQICDRFGEREANTTIRVAINDEAKTDEDGHYTIEDRLEDIASEWWGSDPDIRDDGYYFGGGEVYTTAGNYIEVSKETYDAVAGLVNAH